jgi:NADH-quinone oxidoreductase subunit G
MEIDGKKVSWDGKKMILQVAQDNGIEIPSYCYHPGLSIVASCRICLGEIESPDPKDPTKLVKVPKLVPFCQTPAADGMKATTKSQKSRDNQKAVMEFLLINHPLDCPVCDQAGECYLQDYSYKYGRSESRFLEDKAKKPKKDVGNHILLYSDRCIMCTRCVRFTREISGTSELAVFGRGHKEEIDVFPGRPVNNPLSANVVDICPVGALLDKDFLFSQRVWFLKSTPSISPMNSGGENIEIHHNEGRIYRIKPRFNKDVNKWWISDEARYGFDFVHAPDRLRVPEKINGTAGGVGGRKEISWEDAYAQVGELLRSAVAKNGPGSLACSLSPFDSTEEMYLQIKYVRSIDPGAWIVLQSPRIDGEDKVFKNPANGQTTFTLRAEKAPNRRGAEKMMAHFGGNRCTLAEIASKKIAAVLISADPIRPHNVDERIKAAANVPTIIRLGMRSGGLYDRATLSLPTCSWAEKSGVYENADGKIQAFAQAIPPLEDTRSAGRIWSDLLALGGRYDASAVRATMSAAPGLADYAGIAEPLGTVKVEEMEFAAL